MANYLATDADLAAVADAIRTKGGTSAALAFPDGFVDAIEAISGGGGLPSSVLAHVELTPTSNITGSNPLSIELAATTGAYVLVYYCVDDLAPPASGYLGWAAAFFRSGLGSLRIGAILRSNGTQGTDPNVLQQFNAATGILTFPYDQYSTLLAGKTYEFWLFGIGGVVS